MTRGGQHKQSSDPERKCIVSGVSKNKADLIRFVLGPAEPSDSEARPVVTPDIAGRLPGRGIYVTSDRQMLKTALRKGLFARAARQPVAVPEDLSETVETILLRRVTDLLSLARKGGNAVCGYEKVKDWLIKGQAVVLLQASDGSQRGRDKLRPPGGEDTLIYCLTSQELGLAFGRERAIHAALAVGGLTKRIKHEAVRLVMLRGATDQQVGDTIAGKDTKDV